MTPGQRKELYASTSLFLIILFAIAIISPTGCLHTRPQPRCLSGHTEIREGPLGMAMAAEEVFICDKFEELDAGVGKGCKMKNNSTGSKNRFYDVDGTNGLPWYLYLSAPD